MRRRNDGKFIVKWQESEGEGGTFVVDGFIRELNQTLQSLVMEE